MVKHPRLPAVPLATPAKRRVKLTAAQRRRQATDRQIVYNKTLKGRYAAHKNNARRRGVMFFLAFDEWLTIWKDSGHLDERGNKTADGYVMARNGDFGPYMVGNVRIARHSENVTERNHIYHRRLKFTAQDYTDDWHHVHSAADSD